MLAILGYLVCAYFIVRMIEILTAVNHQKEGGEALFIAAVLMITASLLAMYLIYRASQDAAAALAPFAR